MEKEQLETNFEKVGYKSEKNSSSSFESSFEENDKPKKFVFSKQKFDEIKNKSGTLFPNTPLKPRHMTTKES